MKRMAILTDLTRCIGCESCTLACQEANGLPRPAEPPDTLSDTCWTVVEQRRGVNVRRHCLHCGDPTCASVCPVAALQKQPNGPVTYDEDRCIGCRYCMVACPFSIPKYEWHSTSPRVRKCIMCYEKYVSRGEQPACTHVCPTGATIFGERDRLLHEAKSRFYKDPDRYVSHIYGEHEVGGTDVLYLSPVPFSELGFRTEVGRSAYPQLTWNILSKLPQVVSISGVALAGVWWIIRRRQTLEAQGKAEGGAARGGKTPPETEGPTPARKTAPPKDGRGDA